MSRASLIAGRLKQRVRIERYTRGDSADTVSTVATVWAEVRPITGAERWRAGETESDLTHLVTMRAGVDIRPSDRITFGNRILEVRSVRDISEEDELYEIDAAEVV